MSEGKKATSPIFCPDCKSLVLNEGSYYHCKTCKEYLVTDVQQLAYMDLSNMEVKLLFEEYSTGDYDQFSLLQEKLIVSPTLKILDVTIHDEEDINWFAKFMERHSMLTKLTATWRTDIDPPSFINFLRGLKFGCNLIELALHDLHVSKESINAYEEAIYSLTKLQSLELVGLVLDADVDQLQKISTALKSSKSLYKLDMYDSLASWRLLSGVFEENTSIKKLILISRKLESDTLSDDETGALFNGLKVNTTLEELHIELVSPLAKSTIKILADCLGSNTSITSLHMNMLMDDFDIKLIGDALNGNRTIKELDLSRNNVTYIPEQIFNISSLNQLNISDNELINANPQFISQLLQSNKNLKLLQIQICTTDGCRSLADGLKNNNTLENLYLTQRSLYQDSFSYLSSVLETHPSLTVLYLNYTDNNLAIFSWLKEFIKKNTNLEKLFVMGPYEEIIGCNMLRWLEHNENLTVFGLDLNNNNCVALDATEDEISSLFEVNYALQQLIMWDVSSSKFCERNIKYQNEMRANTAILIHNIARDPYSLNVKLPIEIWINIFKHLRYPGIKSFETMARELFKTYK